MICLVCPECKKANLRAEPVIENDICDNCGSKLIKYKGDNKMGTSKLNLKDYNKGFSLEDWLSPDENLKLQKALKKAKGWASLIIVKNIDLKLDYYYVNGNLVFKRKIK